MPFDVAESFLGAVAEALKKSRIEAIVVGNVAAILNGAPVLTRDVDLLVRDTPLNRKKLRSFALLLGGTEPALISSLTSTERIFGAAVPIDILFDRLIGGLTFASLRSRAEKIALGPHTLVVASLADVIKSKQAANRPKDRAVLPILQDTLAVRRALAREKK